MKWYKHDTDANMDAKLQEVLLDYGLEGYGLYWYCLELIASRTNNKNLTFELEHDARIIARNTGSSAQKVEEMIKSFIRFRLFECSDGRITCLKMAHRLEENLAKTPQAKEIRSKLAQIASKSTDKIPVLNRLNTGGLPLKHLTEVEVEVEVDKTLAQLAVVRDQQLIHFDTFWAIWPRRVGKIAAEKRWNKIKPTSVIMEKIKANIQAHDKVGDWGARYKFCPFPAKYLNEKLWDDEVINRDEPATTTSFGANGI